MQKTTFPLNLLLPCILLEGLNYGNMQQTERLHNPIFFHITIQNVLHYKLRECNSMIFMKLNANIFYIFKVEKIDKI